MPRVEGPAAGDAPLAAVVLQPGRRCCCMKPMMALSITLASLVAMNPPVDGVADLLLASRADAGKLGKPVQEGGAVIGDHFAPGEEAEGVLAVDRRDQVRQEVVQHLAARHDLVRDVLTLWRQ